MSRCTKLLFQLQNIHLLFHLTSPKLQYSHVLVVRLLFNHLLGGDCFCHRFRGKLKAFASPGHQVGLDTRGCYELGGGGC